MAGFAKMHNKTVKRKKKMSPKKVKEKWRIINK